jgi:very-short-patch-repair endonuclease
VAAALAARGWELHTQVGVSAFRIDLGVVDPDAKGSYLAGIECDGATYHSSATARDRDKLREQVLRGLGWQVLRVWSTDWWVDREGTLDRLHAGLQALLEESRARRAVEAAREHEAQQAADEAAAAIAKAMEGAPAAQPGPDQAQPAAPAAGAKDEGEDAPKPPPQRDGDEAGSGRYAGNAAAAVAGVAPAAPTRDAEVFFATAYDATLAALLAQVVQAEGPVRDVVLARRIARMHGWQRTGARIQARVDALATRLFRRTEDAEGALYWP